MHALWSLEAQAWICAALAASCAAGMTDLPFRAFAFSSPPWAGAQPMELYGVGRHSCPAQSSHGDLLDFSRTCPRNRVTRISPLLANWSFFATLLPLQIEREATLFLPSFPSHLHFLSSEL